MSLGIFSDPGQDQNVTNALQPYRDSLQAFTMRTIADVAENICNPFIGVIDPTCPGTPAQSAVGGGACLLVAQSMLHDIPDGDFAIQNIGGCRAPISSGNFTYGDAYTVLPFGDTMVTLKMTGAQVKNVLEDAVNNFLNTTLGGGGGSYPVAAGLRWDLDYTADYGNRFTNVELNSRLNGTWGPLDLGATYKVVTNDYVATPKDGYLTFGEINKADPTAYTNTYVVDAQALIDYAEFVGTLVDPPIEEYSTQKLTLSDGTVYNLTSSAGGPVSTFSPASGPTATGAPAPNPTAPTSNPGPSATRNPVPGPNPSTSKPAAAPTPSASAPANTPHSSAQVSSELFVLLITTFTFCNML